MHKPRSVHKTNRSGWCYERTNARGSFIQNDIVKRGRGRTIVAGWMRWWTREGWPKNPSTKLVIRWGLHEPLSRIQSRLAFLPSCHHPFPVTLPDASRFGQGRRSRKRKSRIFFFLSFFFLDYSFDELFKIIYQIYFSFLFRF